MILIGVLATEVHLAADFTTRSYSTRSTGRRLDIAVDDRAPGRPPWGRRHDLG